MSLEVWTQWIKYFLCEAGSKKSMFYQHCQVIGAFATLLQLLKANNSLFISRKELYLWPIDKF